MTAMDLITLRDDLQPHPGRPKVSSGSTLYEILPRMAESADCTVDVTRDGLTVGCIDAPAAIRALSETFTRSDEASVLTVECAREDYSASLLAHAVEDVDAHLLNLSVMPAEGGRLNVSLRIGHPGAIRLQRDRSIRRVPRLADGPRRATGRPASFS